jgi:glycosyltransferase involved in cell wall biosynthesis
VLVVGSGTRFISGISHHTRYVAIALSERLSVSVILMRQLIPGRLYPGRDRIGAALTDASYPRAVDVFDGVDWYWLPSMVRALLFMRRHRPDTVLFQWWTGAVLHSYLLLALAARLYGARIVVEVHEIQDTGEAEIAPVRWYVDHFGRVFMRMSDAFIVRSAGDQAELRTRFGLAHRPVQVAHPGPYSHYEVTDAQPLREAPAEACNILFFGTIRPYKGLETLVEAFELLCHENEGADYWLTAVGETWEDWKKPLEMIESSPYRDRITLINRYVTDAEVSRWFAGADVVALPYLRSAASGPLHLAMHVGLPLVVTEVGGLIDAASGYDGAILVPSGDPVALRDGVREASISRGKRFQDVASWSKNADALLALASEIDANRARTT